MIHAIIVVVAVLLIAGLIVWGIRAFPWLDPSFKQAAIVLIVIAVGLWVLYTVVNLLSPGTLPALK